jgi:hypothetical protein
MVPEADHDDNQATIRRASKLGPAGSGSLPEGSGDTADAAAGSGRLERAGTRYEHDITGTRLAPWQAVGGYCWRMMTLPAGESSPLRRARDFWKAIRDSILRATPTGQLINTPRADRGDPVTGCQGRLTAHDCLVRCQWLAGLSERRERRQTAARERQERREGGRRFGGHSRSTRRRKESHRMVFPAAASARLILSPWHHIGIGRTPEILGFLTVEAQPQSASFAAIARGRAPKLLTRFHQKPSIRHSRRRSASWSDWPQRLSTWSKVVPPSQSYP